MFTCELDIAAKHSIVAAAGKVEGPQRSHKNKLRFGYLTGK